MSSDRQLETECPWRRHLYLREPDGHALRRHLQGHDATALTGPAMHGLMQDWPLTLNRIIEHAAKWHGDMRSSADGRMDRWSVPATPRSGWRPDASPRHSSRFGTEPGDRVATMAMNSSQHLECWYGIMGIGAICHTLNPRLFNADLEYIVTRAADSVSSSSISPLPPSSPRFCRLAPPFATLW